MTSDIPAIVPELPPPPPEKRVWGGWATAGFGAAVLFAFTIIQTVVSLIGLFVVAAPELGSLSGLQLQDFLDAFMETMMGHLGLLQSFATIISGAAGIGLIILFIKLRGRAGIAEYLGLDRITARGVLLMVAILIGYAALSAGLNNLLGKTDSEQIMYDIYDTSIWPALLWIAVVAFAPAFEEMLFRGFLFEGFRQSRLGAFGAITIPAVIWALTHGFQYELYSLAWILVLGIVMGIVRLKTKSLWNTFILHALVNALATLEIALNLDRFL